MNTKTSFKWQFSPKDFLQKKLTQQEVVAIGLSTSPQVVYWRMIGLGADRLRDDSTELSQGLDLLISEGIITEQRKIEILS
jgi:hypothetical protein